VNNKILLEDCIKEFKESNQINLPDDDVFELFSLSQISKRYNLSYDDIENSIVDGSKEGASQFCDKYKYSVFNPYLKRLSTRILTLRTVH
jgi:hypothetical protein